MYWQKRKLEYDISILPILKSFEEFNSIEAEMYFKWFTGQLKDRIIYLQKFSNVSLDYSENSLIDIWNWFLKNAKIEVTPRSKMNDEKNRLKGYSKEIAEAVLAEQSKQFSLETEYIMRDIAMYLGEVFVKNNPSISWGYHMNVKVNSFANMPLLVGFEDRNFDPPFEANMEPIHMVHVQACNIFDNSQNEKDLKNLYEIWQRMIFN